MEDRPKMEDLISCVYAREYDRVQCTRPCTRVNMSVGSVAYRVTCLCNVHALDTPAHCVCHHALPMYFTMILRWCLGNTISEREGHMRVPFHVHVHMQVRVHLSALSCACLLSLMSVTCIPS